MKGPQKGRGVHQRIDWTDSHRRDDVRRPTLDKDGAEPIVILVVGHSPRASDFDSRLPRLPIRIPERPGIGSDGI